MKNPYTIVALCLIGIAVFLKAGIFNAVLMFLLVGAIPGTNYNVPAVGMLLLLALLIWVILFRLTALESLEIRLRQYIVTKYITRKKHQAKQA